MINNNQKMNAKKQIKMAMTKQIGSVNCTACIRYHSCGNFIIKILI